MTKIKLCGIQRYEDIDVVNELLPDYIGFVFAKKSKRFISYDMAKSLKIRLDKSVKAVGVFVNESIENIIYLVRNDIIDLIQLHGDEDGEYISKLKKYVNIPVIKAFKIKSKADINTLYKEGSDFILLDAGAGDGKTLDESILKDFKGDYFLAGGLSPDNICEKINTLHPFGVDVSSGIETDGKKDADKMRKFVKLVREVENERN